MPAGYNAHADTVLTQTADGRDLNELWAEYQEVLSQWNADRNRLINFLTFPVTDAVEELPIIGSNDADFQVASEYGVPRGFRPEVDHYSFGYDFRWYDIASRFTWQFLSDATQQRIDAAQNQILEADNRLVYNKVFTRIFNNVNNLATIRGNAYNVYTFYNGAGEAPPPYKSNTFDSTHTHFLATNGATIDPGDLQDHINHLAHHGYDAANGYKIVTLMNRTETEVVRLFRAGVSGATYDFIPVQGSSPLFLPDNALLLGSQPTQNVPGFKVVGSYGDLIIVEEDHIPTKYFVSLASGGPDSIGNPVGFREHNNASLRGMRLVKGQTPDYPLIDSYYVRGFGTGVRHRGAGVVSQIVASTTYTPPTVFAGLG